MRLRRIKTRIIVTALTISTAFSGVVGFGFTASAAAPEPKEIIKDLTEYTVGKVIECVPGGDIVQDLLNKGAGYILGWVFDEESSGENELSTQDLMDQVQKVSDKIDEYHKEELDMLKLINANIDSGDFRKQADSVGDDYKGVLAVIKQNEKNITTPGSGVIDKTTYRTYKKITEDATCDTFELAKNFDKMESYILGSRSAANRVPGYNLASQYLMQKVLIEYKEKEHD